MAKYTDILQDPWLCLVSRMKHPLTKFAA